VINDRKVLITGGFGRIGLALVRYLSNLGHQITIVSTHINQQRQSLFALSPNIKCVETNCFDESPMDEIMSGHEVVIHLACNSIPSTSQENPYTDIQDNLIGTVRLFQTCQKVGVSQFIFPSSRGTIYGKVNKYPTDEMTLPMPIAFHGAMKLATENYLRVAEKQGNTKLIILRIANPYGLVYTGKPQGVIDVFIVKLQQGENLSVWGDGHQIRDYLYVTDLLSAFNKSIQMDMSATLNIGSGNGVSINQILTELSHHFDLEKRVIWLPKRGIDSEKSILDISRAFKLMNWSPETTLVEGITRSLIKK